MVSLQVPWVCAEGIVENHGPLSTWTRPPSWSVEISIGTSEVAEVVVRASSLAVRARTGAAPEVVRPVSTTFPTWYVLTAALVAASRLLTDVPTMKS